MNWEQFAMKVQAISKIGKLFSQDPFAVENYEELETLSIEMLNKKVLSDPIASNVYERSIYPTPNVSVRTMVFNESNQLLMVQEKDDGGWSLPGGWCDVYESPTESAIKEVRQESGCIVQIDSLLGVFFRDKYKAQMKSLISEYVIYFKATLIGGELKANHEILDVNFFDLENLPNLSFKNSKEEIERALLGLESPRIQFD